jgi:hypothetical protein
MSDSPSPPPAPDYSGAANATAAGNLQAAQYATKANRVNQYTPYGNLTYSQADPNDPNSQWSSNISLSPTGSALLGYQDAASLGLGQQTTNALGRVDQSLSQPFDQSSVNDIYNKSYDAQTARLDPQWNARQQQTETQLVNQGLHPGTEAYDNAMRDFNTGRNDAYSQATQSAISTMPQTYGLAASARNQPLNELNALRTGSQVTNPTFNSSIPQQQTTAGANLSGATQATGQYNQGLYNQQVATNNSQNSALMGLVGTAAGFMF